MHVEVKPEREQGEPRCAWKGTAHRLGEACIALM